MLSISYGEYPIRTVCRKSHLAGQADYRCGAHAHDSLLHTSRKTQQRVLGSFEWLSSISYWGVANFNAVNTRSQCE